MIKWAEKEKLWLKYVKELSRLSNWKFKSNFIFKKVGDIYLSATFYADRKENSISGWLGYKPYNIDNVFWDIIDEQPSKNMPLSFRAEGAFSIRKIIHWQYCKKIKDESNPQNEISEILNEIKLKVGDVLDRIKTLNDFKIEMLKDEKSNSVGIITALVEQRDYANVILKIEEYKSKSIDSGFRFGNKDFFDLAKEYCEKNSI